MIKRFSGIKDIFFLFVLSAVRAGMWIGRRKKKTGRFNFIVEPPQLKERRTMLTLSLTTEQRQKVGCKPSTEGGAEAPIDGQVEFTVVSGSCTVQRVDATTSYILAGDPGDSEVLVEADADLGDGKELISDIVKVSVRGARAANLGLFTSPPELKETPPPTPPPAPTPDAARSVRR